MGKTQGLGLTLVVWLLQLSTLVSSSPVQRNALVAREITITTTVWIAPTTVTVNPQDPTITRDAGWTSTLAPPPITNTITSSCITYNFSYPPGNPLPPTKTETITARSTVTVTDTNRPLQTQYSFHTPTITVPTPLATLVSYHCLNTMVIQYHNWEYLTWTWSYWSHTATSTGLCLTTSTRSTTIPGVTLPTGTKSMEDWEYFSVPGESIVTKHTVAIATDTTVTVDGTSTRTVCQGNPRPTVTTTVRITPGGSTAVSTVTKTVTGPEGCQSDGSRPREANTPVEVHTVVYTTVTVISNTAFTLTGTAVVDVNTQEFPVTRIAYTTVTGVVTGTATEAVTVC